jgi:hypothetical protein
MSHKDAAAYVAAVDRGGAQFYELFFPSVKLEPEHFSITFNKAALSESQMVTGAVALVEEGEPLPPLKSSQKVCSCA